MKKIISATIMMVSTLSSICFAQNFNVINQAPENSAQTNTENKDNPSNVTVAESTPAATTTPMASVSPSAETQAVSAAAQPASSAPVINATPAGSATSAYEAAKAFAGQPETSKYTLGAEDVIEVTVARHPEVTGKYTINNEGKIQYEFVGDIQLLGLTKEDAANIISKKLATYIVNPEVTVKIIEYMSKVVYVVGEVGAPGKIYMRGDTITVRDALLAARLPQLTASTDNATLFTPAADGKVIEKKVNVYTLLYKGDLRENYVMKPGDTLYLPATLWAKVARFINPVAQPVGAAAGTGRILATGM